MLLTLEREYIYNKPDKVLEEEIPNGLSITYKDKILWFIRCAKALTSSILDINKLNICNIVVKETSNRNMIHLVLPDRPDIYIDCLDNEQTMSYDGKLCDHITFWDMHVIDDIGPALIKTIKNI